MDLIGKEGCAFSMNAATSVNEVFGETTLEIIGIAEIDVASVRAA